MKTPVFILLFLLLSSLSSAKDAGAEDRMPADVGRISECYSVSSLHADYFATETVQTAVPSPTIGAWPSSGKSTVNWPGRSV